MKKYPMLINGEQVAAQDDTWIASTNPYTLQDHGQIPRGKKIDADLAVESAYNAFHSDEWQSLTASSRGKLLRKIGDLISENIDELATLEVQDNGKLLSEMRAQVQYLPEYFYYYGGLADKIEGGIIPVEKAEMQVHKKYEPLGVCVAITAWNSPLMLACWKIAPALAAGNTVVIKPSEYTSISTLVFANLFEKAGFPKGVVNVVTGYGSEIGEALISHPKVAKVAFTGSEMGGKAVGQKAIATCKHVTLELGGKSPNIVFADANIDNAVKGAIAGIFAASGQTCIAGSRLLVEESIHDQFVQKLVEFAKRAKRGDPMLSDTNVGPIANKMQYDKVLSYIDIAKKEGAKCVLGGAPAGDLFVEPTIFTNVSNHMRIAQEEVFGPVLSVISFKSEKEAIQIANDSNYGLAAGIWTENMTRALTLPSKLQAGTVWVNTYRTLSYMAPFGGYKQSGFGRENGQDAIFEYLQTKSIWYNIAKEMSDPFQMRL